MTESKCKQMRIFITEIKMIWNLILEYLNVKVNHHKNSNILKIDLVMKDIYLSTLSHILN